MIVEKRISFVRLTKIIWKRLLAITIVACLTVAPLIFFELSRYSIDRSIPLIIGTAIAIFLGFRTNSAYERWWEARRIWGGIINDSLSLGRLTRDLIGPDEPESEALVRQICHRQAAWAYALDCQLKGLPLDDDVERLLTPAEFETIKNSADPVLELLSTQSQSIRLAANQGWIDTVQGSTLQQMLSNMTNHLGGCNRIKGTNFPTHYSFFNEVFIWIFLILLGFCLPSHSGFDDANEEIASYLAIPAMVLIGWVFFMVDGIAQYMQDPFENNRNVIPMKALSTKIEIGLRSMLGDTDLPEPKKPVEGALW